MAGEAMRGLFNDRYYARRTFHPEAARCLDGVRGDREVHKIGPVSTTMRMQRLCAGGGRCLPRCEGS